MATQKPISTISYNTEAFLREKLEIWLSGHIIQAYQYICHKGEDGDKDHIHLRIEPNKKLDPMELSEQLREYQFGSQKPLGCRPFRPSKEEDWILYAVHDPQYLRMKYGGGEKGEKLPYKWQDIKVPEMYDIEIAFIRAKASMNHSSVNMATRIQDGYDPINLILEGENPYVVNAIVKALSDNDYLRLIRDKDLLEKRYFGIIQALLNAKLDVVEEDGKYYIVPLFDDQGKSDDQSGSDKGGSNEV